MRKMIHLTLALALAVGLCAPAYAAGGTFTDVPQGRWYYTWVEQAARQGFVSGYADGRYGPDDNVTYAQYAIMLCKAIYPEELAGMSDYGKWWEPACNLADRHSLWKNTSMSGGGWERTANTPIHREQMAQMMYNALVDKKAGLPSYDKVDDAMFTIRDAVDITPDNATAVYYCYAAGLISGDNQDNFAPQDQMTRAQAASVLCRIYSYVTGGTTGTQPVTPAEPDPKPETPVPSAGKPEGAIGGRYDTSMYTVPADANKDGWLTEDEVAAVIADIMEEYPKGTPWGEDKKYASGNWKWTGSGCAAFAMMASDRIFGDLPVRTQKDAYSVHIGDLVENIAPHWSLIRKIWWCNEEPSQGVMYTHAGNVGGEIGAGGISYEELVSTISVGEDIVYTRYPAE